MIKLKSISFPVNGIRKLKNFRIDFAERITIIAGHNGTGKSTILGLIASASGYNERSYLGKDFSYDINNIIHFDPIELDKGQLSQPWPRITYTIHQNGNDEEHWKNIRITKRPNRLRSVSSTDKDSPNKKICGQDQKIPLPTIYLGMVRMLPIGESDESDIENQINNMEEEDSDCIKDFIQEVISGSVKAESTRIVNQTIKNTNKNSLHPEYVHDSKSISLGQDSLSSIATAIASFNKLKRELNDNYIGGVLIIDEIDAGFHPHAQRKLIETISKWARKLSLQILATTHSPFLLDYLNKKISSSVNEKPDKIVYLADTKFPNSVEWSIDQILNDMNLEPIKRETKKVIPSIEAFLEDLEALDFLKGIMNIKRSYKVMGDKKKIKVKFIDLGVSGCSLVNFPKKSPYFNKALLIVDGDTKIPKNNKNTLKLAALEKSNPEKTIYEYINEICNGPTGEYPETYQTLLNKGASSDLMTSIFLSSPNCMNDREKQKKWFRKCYDEIVTYDLLKLWAKDNKKQVEKFIKDINKKLDELVS